jgi:hypothetical protein
MNDPAEALSPATLPFLKSGVGQVAQVVESLEATVEEYARLFGIGPWDFYTYERPLVSRMTYRGTPADYSMRIALSWFGPTRIELIQVVRGPTVYDEFIKKHGYGVQHLGLVVPEMAKALAEARAAGLEVVMDGSGFGLDGDGAYAYLDTEERLGITLELVERPKRRRPPEKVFPAKAP